MSDDAATEFNDVESSVEEPSSVAEDSLEVALSSSSPAAELADVSDELPAAVKHDSKHDVVSDAGSSKSEVTHRRKRQSSCLAQQPGEDEAVDESAAGSSSSSNSSSAARREFGTSETLPSTRTRKALHTRAYQEEENESACCECQGGGELICCDTCIRAFHLVCLPQRYRPPEQGDTSTSTEWSCPVCLYFRVHDDLETRRGVLFNLRHPLAVPPLDCDPRLKRLKCRRALDRDDYSDADEEDPMAGESSGHSHRIRRYPHQELFHPAHHHYLFEDIKKRKASLVPTDSETQSASEPTHPSHATRRVTASNERKATSAAGSSTSSTCGTVGRMNVGPSFQIPQLPISFLEVQAMGRSYDRVLTNRFARAVADCRLVYSASDWKRIADRLHTGVPFEGESKPDEPCTEGEGTAEEQQSDNEVDVIQSLLLEIETSAAKSNLDVPESVKENFIDTEEKLRNFCMTLASQWSTRCNWPYCDEYAYKILHHARYDAKAALGALEDPNFDFHTVCDPPLRPYFNKWRPKDKRSLFPSTPFPPPQHFRAAFGTMGARTRQQQAALGYR